jgi:hypothetical protein
VQSTLRLRLGGATGPNLVPMLPFLMRLLASEIKQRKSFGRTKRRYCVSAAGGFLPLRKRDPYPYNSVYTLCGLVVDS